ncbi:MAG: iron-containing alcohol dehydrogenase [Synergistaceae bacterium]|jgi:alcohol dehydrogenase class IV|nr:iron-containing alcohol dehydrogenase [Synergistaceae bacterium]
MPYSNAKERAGELLKTFKGDSYTFGIGVLEQVGEIVRARKQGRKIMVVGGASASSKPVVERVAAALKKAGLELVPDRCVEGARPNAPREDVYRLESYLLHFGPDCVVSVGGGSGIDAVKAAVLLGTLGTESPEIDAWFGTGLVTEALKRTEKSLLPHIAVETSASSGAHLTKYSNITDPVAGQKKLIVDDAIVPVHALFDYSVTATMPASLTVDGALDALAHAIEVFYGVSSDALDSQKKYELCKEITETVLDLVLGYTKRAVEEPGDLEAREALGLATDLGGYAIMVGGTNGAHLTSFSLVDITSHGRACGIMNPYYTVLFAASIEKQLRVIGARCAAAGYVKPGFETLSGRDLAVAVAEGMRAFSLSVGAETRLGEFPKFTPACVERALAAAKDPQLKMKLQNMPAPMSVDQVDEYMGSVLEGAVSGDFSKVKTL